MESSSQGQAGEPAKSDSGPSQGGASEPSSRRPIPSRWPARILLLVTIGIVFGPVVYHEIGPAEMAKWHLAAARADDKGVRPKEALASYKRAIDWHPNSWLNYQERAHYHTELGRYELALADWERSLELFPLEHRTETASWTARLSRDDVLVHAERYDRALESAQLMLDEAEKNRFVRMQSNLLNWRAYIRAIADQDVELALEEIDQSIKLYESLISPKETNAFASLISEILGGRGDPNPLASLIDTRGFVLYRLGNYEAAKAEVDRAIKLFRRDLQGSSQSVLRDRETLAVMYYHRALVHEAMQNQPAADRDFKKVRDLGSTPNPHLF